MQSYLSILGEVLGDGGEAPGVVMTEIDLDIVAKRAGRSQASL